MTTCPRLKKDCANLGIGRECLALSNTDFGYKTCPFYKPTTTDYDAKYIFEGRDGIWKAVRGYQGRYYVSDLGEIYNYRNRQVNVYYLNGKPFVKLQDRFGFVARYYVALIVADAFVKGEGGVSHKDNDYANCKAENLYRRNCNNGNEEI